MDKLLFILLIITSIVSTASADMGTYEVHEIKIDTKTYFWRNNMSDKVKDDYCVYNRDGDYLSEFEDYLKIHKKEIYQSFVSILYYKLYTNQKLGKTDSRVYSVGDRIEILDFNNVELIRSYLKVPYGCEEIVNLKTTDQSWVDEKDLEHIHNTEIELGDLRFYSIRNNLESEKIKSLIAKIENLAKYKDEEYFSKLKERKAIFDELRDSFVVIILYKDGC